MNPATMAGGKSDKYDRSANEFYQTTPETIKALLKHRPDFRNRVSWDCACGDGAISQFFPGKAVSSDIRPTFCPNMFVADFRSFTAPPPGVEQIVTNPPFDQAREFIIQCRNMGLPFALLHKTQFWNVGANAKLFRLTGPEEYCPLTWRPAMAPERGQSPTMDFAWSIWGASYADRCVVYPLDRPQ